MSMPKRRGSIDVIWNLKENTQLALQVYPNAEGSGTSGHFSLNFQPKSGAWELLLSGDAYASPLATCVGSVGGGKLRGAVVELCSEISPVTREVGTWKFSKWLWSKAT